MLSAADDKATRCCLCRIGLAVTRSLSGCGATVNLRVVVDRSGPGSVTLAVTVPKATAAQIED